LVVNEAQTSLGLMGTMFAFKIILPAILVLSRTLGAMKPLIAVLADHKISTVSEQRNYLPGITHGNDH
jgi:acetylornithine/succinyldiaminopimelate/putrescine aminotransferase